MTARAWAWWGALAGALALSWWASSHPGDELPAVGWWGQHDKLVHATAWAALAGLAAAGRLATGWRPRAAVAFAIALGVAYGFVDEWHQSHVPRRDSSLGDVAADTTGAIAGSLAVAWVYRRRCHGDPP